MKNRSLTQTSITLIGLLALGISSASAKPGHGKGKSEKGNRPQQSQQSKGADKAAKEYAKSDRKQDQDFGRERIVRFGDGDRGSILSYFSNYRNNDGGLPPGLAKNLRRGKPLPPGWQAKVAPGYRISDAWWSSFSPVSYDYFPKMRREPNTRLYMHGDRLVRVYEPRREVLDVVVLPNVRY
jgi:hypothetical protein